MLSKHPQCFLSSKLESICIGPYSYEDTFVHSVKKDCKFCSFYLTYNLKIVNTVVVAVQTAAEGMLEEILKENKLKT